MLLITRRPHREGSQAVDLETGSDIFKPSTTFLMLSALASGQQLYLRSSQICIKNHVIDEN